MHPPSVCPGLILRLHALRLLSDTHTRARSYPLGSLYIGTLMNIAADSTRRYMQFIEFSGRNERCLKEYLAAMRTALLAGLEHGRSDVLGLYGMAVVRLLSSSPNRNHFKSRLSPSRIQKQVYALVISCHHLLASPSAAIFSSGVTIISTIITSLVSMSTWPTADKKSCLLWKA
jgi:hypothetical protein